MPLGTRGYSTGESIYRKMTAPVSHSDKESTYRIPYSRFNPDKNSVSAGARPLAGDLTLRHMLIIDGSPDRVRVTLYVQTTMDIPVLATSARIAMVYAVPYRMYN